jgi:hypothetical protein
VKDRKFWFSWAEKTSSLSFAERGSVTRFFASGFIHELSSPKPLKIALGPFDFFRKFVEIFTSQCAPPVSKTPAVNNWNNIRLLTPSSELEGKNLPICYLY